MFSIACLFAVQFVSFLEEEALEPFRSRSGIIVQDFCGLLCRRAVSTRLAQRPCGPEPHRSNVLLGETCK